MSNFIESGREAMENREKAKQSLREIFTTAVEILRKKGKPAKRSPFFKYQVIDHTVISEPTVSIRISAGANLDKARKVEIRIEGVGRVMVTKRVVKGQENFKGVHYNPYTFNYNSLSSHYPWITQVEVVIGFLNAIKQVNAEITPKTILGPASNH